MKVLVYGVGTMGRGIGQLFAQNNFEVLFYDILAEYSNNALKLLEKDFSRLVTKGKISEEDKEKFLSNVKVIENLEDGKDVDLVVEAITENVEVKKEVFRNLDEIINNDAILASNTSSLSITELALVTGRPENVIGMHFFNPAPVMNLIEIINGYTTSAETTKKIEEISGLLGKNPVKVKEAPGFVVNRMLVPMINEAIIILSEGVATAEDIDTAMKFGANHPIGPLALGDLIGLDVCLFIMDILHRELGLDKYAASPLLRKMVRANKLGRKTKEGFYKYS